MSSGSLSNRIKTIQVISLFCIIYSMFFKMKKRVFKSTKGRAFALRWKGFKNFLSERSRAIVVRSRHEFHEYSWGQETDTNGNSFDIYMHYLYSNKQISWKIINNKLTINCQQIFDFLGFPNNCAASVTK